jgi:hypothetical protein
VRALHEVADSHQVALGDQLLDLEVQVGDGAKILGDMLSFGLWSNDVGPVGVVAHEVGCQQLLCGVKVQGCSRLYPAADDGLLDHSVSSRGSQLAWGPR